MIQITWVEIVLTGWLTATLVGSIGFCIRQHKSVLNGHPVASTQILAMESAYSGTEQSSRLAVDIGDQYLGAMVHIFPSQVSYSRENQQLRAPSLWSEPRKTA
jgi:hypothetical protein